MQPLFVRTVTGAGQTQVVNQQNVAYVGKQLKHAVKRWHRRRVRRDGGVKLQVVQQDALKAVHDRVRLVHDELAVGT